MPAVSGANFRDGSQAVAAAAIGDIDRAQTVKMSVRQGCGRRPFDL
jgi:hypothetical protein